MSGSGSTLPGLYRSMPDTDTVSCAAAEATDLVVRGAATGPDIASGIALAARLHRVDLTGRLAAAALAYAVAEVRL